MDSKINPRKEMNVLLFIKTKIIKKCTNKKGITELVTVIILLIMFASVSGYCAAKVLGSKENKTGIIGAGESVNDAMLSLIP